MKNIAFSLRQTQKFIQQISLKKNHNSYKIFTFSLESLIIIFR